MNESHFFLYNTLCSIYLWDCEAIAKDVLQQAAHEAERVRMLLDYYDPESELSRLNRAAGKSPFVASDELFCYISRLMQFAQLSGGAVDPTVAPLLDAWDFTSLAPKCPTKAKIETALQLVGCEKVHLHGQDSAVSFQSPEMRLDAGATGKGYAVDRVCDVLLQAGVKRAVVDFGGNLRMIGARNDQGDPWKVNLQAPWRTRGESLGYMLLQTGAVATSGGYDRYIEVDGQTYSHLLNPLTGYPAEDRYLSTTIISKSAFICDVMSTAFFVMEFEKAVSMLQHLDPDAGYLLIKKDGEAMMPDWLKECTTLKET